MDKWHHKLAVVTGASSGIGAACCKLLVEGGMVVVGLARRLERVEQLRDLWKGNEEHQKRLHAIKCDVRNEAEVCSVFRKIESEYGPISVLINNAGLACKTEMLQEGNSEDLRNSVETNILGVAYCTREAFRSMSKTEGSFGHVFLINSIVGHKPIIVPGSLTSLYGPSKHAVNCMTEGYRQEFQNQKTNIRVTSISPGVVNTELFLKEGTKTIGDVPSLNPEDIAEGIMYCLRTPKHVQVHELTIKPMGEKL